jgi:ribosomal protein S18 acetylase RimI-like enzyme
MGATGDTHVRDARDSEQGAIRALTLGAYGEYATIMAPTAWHGLESAILTALESKTADRIVAERDGRIVGSVMLFPPEANAYGEYAAPGSAPELRLLAVDPAERGHGIGEALVAECVRRARASGATELGLHSSASMKAAVRMYAKLGFERAPERDFQPDGAEVVWGFRLPFDDTAVRPGGIR